MNILKFSDIIAATAQSDEQPANGQGFMLNSGWLPSGLQVSVDSSNPIDVRPFVFYSIKFKSTFKTVWNAVIDDDTGLTLVRNPSLDFVLFDQQCELSFVSKPILQDYFQFSRVVTAATTPTLNIAIPKSAVGVTVGYYANETPDSNVQASIGVLDVGDGSNGAQLTEFLDDSTANAIASTDVRGEDNLLITYPAHASNNTTFNFYVAFQF